ncbi:uncharacterized protein LOC116696559 [Etheostoma spectabile]|uniref:uncharacterized protein LOC116696559 n=1 Tax=Etheostoma spectabile TaxID=54343 RepID=UPI0013AF95D1|nr:uncharacterized protein LOC116696559 [Etheostoma spectabile]
MILLLITLLLLHQGYALISVKTVQLGRPATFTCVLPDSEYSNTRVKWYKQSFGDTLTLITTLMKGTENPMNEKGFPPSRFNANHTTTMSSLTILKTIQEDEALYHCAFSSWSTDQFSGTYLSLKGNTQRTSNYTVVQQPTVSNTFHPGDSVTLQCSVLSDAEKSSCPGEHSVHWFGVRSHKSHPHIIYTDENGHDGCDKISDTQKSCVYHFSKNVSSSDAGTYYCAVATCGEILFGDGTKLDIEGTGAWSFGIKLTESAFLLLLCAVLAISVIVIAVLIYAIKENKCGYCSNKAAVSLQENVAKRNSTRDEDTWIYSAVIFTVMKAGNGGIRDAKAAERIYTAVKPFGLD